MGVDAGDVAPREVGELGERAHTAQVAPPAAPDGKRRAPVAVARERPVDVVGQPLAEAAVFDVARGASRPSHWPRADRPCAWTWRCTSWACPSRSAASGNASSAGTSARTGQRRMSRPADSSRSLISVLAARTSRPTSQSMSEVNRPSGPTGLSDGRPLSRPICRSISPKAGARCTSPVPSSVVT